MKLLLTSAGLSNQSIIKAFSDLVGLPNDKIKIAFIPTAANVEEGDKSWLIEDYINLKNQKYSSIDIVDIASVSKDIWLPRLKEANVIFVGGGNTFFLMSWLKKSGLVKILPELLKTRVYVGISAGSMVATINLRMSTSQKSYSEKIFPLENDEGLGFVNFHIRPHLNSEFFPKVRVEYLAEEAKEIPEPIYAIDNNTAVMINDNQVKVISEGNWKKFN
jgi:dipeptidase E